MVSLEGWGLGLNLQQFQRASNRVSIAFSAVFKKEIAPDQMSSRQFPGVYTQAERTILTVAHLSNGALFKMLTDIPSRENGEKRTRSC